MTTTPAPDDLLLEARGIVRRYAGSVALKSVTFRVHRHAVNVLIGENGAGKSTLMRILAGVETPDEGMIFLDGLAIQVRSPREASAHGISIVHQELAVLPNLTVSDNIFAGRELLQAPAIIDHKAEQQRSSAALDRLQHPVAATVSASQLSLGSRQMLELARALDHGSRLLILDEPTSALSMTEAESLFRVIAEMKRAGVTIIYISHRLHELMHLGDYFTVLRSGNIVGEAPRAEVTRDWIVERMSGRAAVKDNERLAPANSATPLLQVSGLSLAPSRQGEAAQSAVNNVSLTLRRGEILGIYGLLGAGRTELLEALAGERRVFAGTISLNGKAVRLRSVKHAMKAGLVLVPEDRQRDGLIPELSIRENIVLTATDGPLLSEARERSRVSTLIKDLNIVANNMDLPVTALSGGNQQKVLLARCLLHSPAVLLLDEPTRGVDVGAKAEIYRTLWVLADKGLSILFTSSEIEETRTLADRVLVLCQGYVSAEFDRNHFTDEDLFAAASPHVVAHTAATGPVITAHGVRT